MAGFGRSTLSKAMAVDYFKKGLVTIGIEVADVIGRQK